MSSATVSPTATGGFSEASFEAFLLADAKVPDSKSPGNYMPFTFEGREVLRAIVRRIDQVISNGITDAKCGVAGGAQFGKTILELGCAEGLMSQWFVDRNGAASVHGIEIVQGHVDLGRQHIVGRQVKLEVANCDTWRPKRAYDVSVALALLHKLQDPLACLAAMAEATKEMVVVRLPSACSPWVITDARTDFRPWDVDKCLRLNGFELVDSTMGPFNEPTGFWRRK